MALSRNYWLSIGIRIPTKPFPHVHLESGLGLHRDLIGIHVPTGQITLEDVVRFAIEELGVRPRLARWRSVLEQTRARRGDAAE